MATTLGLTRDDIIKMAMRRIGALAQGATPTSTELSEAADELNSILKSLDGNIFFKWFVKSASATVATAAGTSSYTLASDTHWVESATYTANSLDYALNQITVGEYAAITNKALQGIPMCFFVSMDLIIPKIYVYPTPNATAAITYWYRRKLDILDSSSDTLDIPEEFSYYVVLALTAALSHEYGRPLNEREFHENLAMSEFNKVLDGQRQQLTSQVPGAPSPLLNDPVGAHSIGVKRAQIESTQER